MSGSYQWNESGVAAIFMAAALLCAPGVHADPIHCRVVGVTDGDTLTCLSAENKQIKVRLAQIDAPESSQPFGKRSKQALSDQVFSQDVGLERETTDRYGRMVAKVIKDGKDVNLEMVRQGMAWVYDQYAHDKVYFSTQRTAQAEKLGLWADDNPVRPSEWRRNGGKAGGGNDAALVVAKKSSSGFTCSGKTTCREMTTCAEAEFYLRTCGVTRLDRDHDGIPCESICR